MSNFRPLLIQAELRTPLSIVDPIPLEGILYDVRYRADPSTKGTPLDCIAYTDGIERASVGFISEDGTQGLPEGATTSVWGINLRADDAYRITPGKGEGRTISGSSPFRNKLQEYPTLSAVRHVVFQALGDPEKIEGMLSAVSSIGTLRNRGYGEVAEWSVEEVEADPDDCGWFAGETVLRRLPVHVVEKRFGTVPDSIRVTEGKLAVPGWMEQEKQAIVAPTVNSVRMKRREIRKLLTA